jgi:hypothetical protein
MAGAEMGSDAACFAGEVSSSWATPLRLCRFERAGVLPGRGAPAEMLDQAVVRSGDL